MGRERRKQKRKKLSNRPNLTKLAKACAYIGAGIGLLLVFSIIFAVFNVSSSKFMRGIKVAGVDVSNLTYSQAKDLINNEIQNKINSGISLTHLSTTYNLTLEDLNCTLDVDASLNEAYKLGRSGNLLIDNYTIFALLFFDKEILINIDYNKEQLEKQLTYIEGQLEDRFIDNQFYVEDDKLYVIRGKDGVIIDLEKFDGIIKNDVKNLKSTDGYEIPVLTQKVSELSEKEIYEKIHQEPQDAYFTESPFKIYSHIIGVDFQDSEDEVAQMLAVKQDDYIIPLKLTPPEITIENLEIEAFPNILGQYTTKYDVTNKNKVNNLELAVSKLNDVIIAPGKTFSYNDTLGARTVENGYKEAAIYSAGKITTGLGGGICQVSSTLYNAVLLSNLDILERANHMFVPSYIIEGRDATVYYGSLDFKFINNRKYPIKISAFAKDGIVKISILGISEEEYKVEIATEVTDIIPYKTTYVTDSTLQADQEVVIQEGKNGMKVNTYKILKKGDIEVSKELISTDTYKALEETIATSN